MACPFFMPTERFEGRAWLHPSRLPLGAGWHGRCTAGHPDAPPPTDEHVQRYCNLGYATTCSDFPSGRSPTRSVWRSHTHTEEQISWLRLRIEPSARRAWRPGVCTGRWSWISPHPDPRIQKMAECYLESHLRKFESIYAALALENAREHLYER